MANQLSAQGFAELQRIGGFEIKPAPRSFQPSKAIELDIGKDHASQLSAILHQMPSLSASEYMGGLYAIEFPEGLPHTLMRLKQGGFSTNIVNEVTHDITGSASLYNVTNQAAMLSVFSVMSIMTSQYFLAEINNELKLVNEKLDNILEFLYGDKKAELLSEISFARYAYENYTSIMKHAELRVSVISNIYQSKKVAMKDIEFYLRDLERIVTKETKSSDSLNNCVNDSVQVAQSINLSLQLFALCCLLEALYGENTDTSYVKYISSDLKLQNDRCEKRIIACFSGLQEKIKNYKSTPLKKIDKEELIMLSSSYKDDAMQSDSASVYRRIIEIIKSLSQPTSFVIDESGQVFLSEIS